MVSEESSKSFVHQGFNEIGPLTIAFFNFHTLMLKFKPDRKSKFFNEWIKWGFGFKALSPCAECELKKAIRKNTTVPFLRGLSLVESTRVLRQLFGMACPPKSSGPLWLQSSKPKSKGQAAQFYKCPTEVGPAEGNLHAKEAVGPRTAHNGLQGKALYPPWVAQLRLLRNEAGPIDDCCPVGHLIIAL